MQSYITLLFHLVMLHVCLYVIYLTSKEPIPWYRTISFLTNQTHYLMTLYYLQSVVQDLQQLKKKRVEYSAFLHTYYQQIQALSLLVCINFWKIYYRDPKLMIDRADYNWTLGNYMHGINTLIFWIEPLLTQHYCHITCIQKIKNHFCFVVYYLSYTYLYEQVTGQYIYPFQAALKFDDICFMYLQMILASLSGDLILSKFIMKQKQDEIKKEH